MKGGDKVNILCRTLPRWLLAVVGIVASLIDASCLLPPYPRSLCSTPELARWEQALEHYRSAVTDRNTRALGTSRRAFALYVLSMHKRIHPLFAVRFLEQWDRFTLSRPLNDPSLMTRLEIVLDGKDGSIIQMGVVRSSGLVAFDVAALESVERAAPFGPASAELWSSDGNVYIQWAFYRDPVHACSESNSHPFLLDLPASTQADAGAAPP